MKQNREINVNDVRNLVGKLLTIVDATVPSDRQKATKDLVTQAIWQVFNVVGDWEEDGVSITYTNANKRFKVDGSRT